MGREQVRDAEAREPYEVSLTDEAVYAYASIAPDRIYERVGELIDTLARFPYYGQVYEPYYAAAQSPVPCRVLFCAQYGIYYCVDDVRREVTVLAIEDERRDPRRRFGACSA